MRLQILNTLTFSEIVVDFLIFYYFYQKIWKTCLVFTNDIKRGKIIIILQK